jgi:hypothetical protein
VASALSQLRIRVGKNQPERASVRLSCDEPGANALRLIPKLNCDKALDAESIRNNSEVGIAQLNLGGCSSLRPSPSCGSSSRHGLMQVRYPSIERLESVPISEDQ